MIERDLDDPLALEEFRERRQQESLDETITVGQIRADLSRMLEGSPLRDMDADSATAWWAMEKDWTEIAKAYLSNSVIEDWCRMRMPPAPGDLET